MSQVGVPQICGTPDGLMAQVVSRMQAVQACILFAWKKLLTAMFAKKIRKDRKEHNRDNKRRFSSRP
jgi:hypothetical protein